MAVVRATSDEVVAAMRRLVLALTGQGNDPWGMVEGLQLRMGMVLLDKISTAFAIKSCGGTGEDGIKWKPLKPETIARRRLSGPDIKGLKAIGIRAKNVYKKGATGGKVYAGYEFKGMVRGSLSPAEDREWRKIFVV